MGHAPGWIELYELLAAGEAPPPALVAQWLAERPDLAVPRLEVECDCCWGDRGLEVMSPSVAMRRLLHHGARSLGATVAFDFCVPSVTPPAES